MNEAKPYDSNPYESPTTEEAQPPHSVTKARVMKEMLLLAGYFAGMTVLPFIIAWVMQFF